MVEQSFSKTKKAKSIKDCFESIILSSKRKPKLIETDREKEIYNNLFEVFSKNNNIKQFSRNSDLGAVFAEGFNRTEVFFKDKFLKRLMVIGLMYYLEEQINTKIEYILARKLTPTQAILKKMKVSSTRIYSKIERN